MALDCSFSLGGEDIWVAVLGREVRISGAGQNIWEAVLMQEVRISGAREDIWMAVLGRELRKWRWVRISEWQF